MASRFLRQKVINGAGGLEPTPWMAVVVAAQACVPVLALGLRWYRGWREILLYPQRFLVQENWQGEDGVVHQGEEWHIGEAWEQGLLILSWSEIDPDGEQPESHGLNVVIHEFAHKIDAANGHADGYPPLHRDMNTPEWTKVFTHHYNNLVREVEAGHETDIDPYAATHPAEFFAVLSEYFFCDPPWLASRYPDLYQLLCRFYQQEPYIPRH